MHTDTRGKQGNDELLRAGVLGIAMSVRRASMPRPLVLRRLGVAETRIEGLTAALTVEALIEPRSPVEEASLTLRAMRPGALIDAETGSNNGDTVIVMRICAETPASFLRDPGAVPQVAEQVSETIIAALSSAALLLVARPVIEKSPGKEHCLDPGTGMSKLLDMLVETYGPEKALELYDDYLAKPGMILVDEVAAYMTDTGVCFTTTS